MKVLGMILIVVSAIVLSLEKNVASERRLFVLEEIYRFIERIRLDVKCYLKPISEIAADFSSDVLSKTGFLSDVGEKGAHAAYRSLSEKICFMPKEKRIMEKFFSALGTGYADEEIKLIEVTLSELSDVLKAQRENLPKEKKLSCTLSCAGAMALIILLI